MGEKIKIMKRFLPYILIVLIFVQLLVPFTIGSGVKNNLEIRSNKAEATDSIRVRTTAYKTETSIKVEVRVVWGLDSWRTSDGGVLVTLLDGFNTVIDTRQVELVNVPKTSWLPEESTAAMVQIQKTPVIFPDLKQNTTYGINTVAMHAVTSWWEITKFAIGKILPTPDISISTIADPNPLSITITKEDGTDFIPAGEQISINDNAILPVCEISRLGETFGGCVGRFFYWAFFKPTSYIFALTGRLLDISVDYSVKDTSYRSPFVVEGWGVVRDFCNMFFIFILLYIAFGTILNLHSVKTKEMIINVVIIGLLINFSLFATQVIIDTSNILTRVFYNSQTIEIGPLDNGVIKNQVGSQGEIQLSLALVAKINPQRLILDAGRANNIQTKNTVAGNEEIGSNGISAGTFILVTLLASVINVVGLITFLMAALIFISRVIGLWLAMIFAPFAFFSYTVPAMQEWGMVGWKKWWPETLKLAFLAPVFIFFMYLIIKFLETGLGLFENQSATGLDFILGIFIPFIFIMILLTKAKDIAKKMSGTIGESITNIAKKIGGTALGVGLGVATGGAAMALRGTAGRGGSWLANNETLKKAEAKGIFGAKTLRNIGSTIGKGSMDIRGVKIAGKGLSDTGLKGLGKSKEGGFDKRKEEKIEKRIKRVKELEVGEDSTLKQDVYKKQNALDAAKSNVTTQTNITTANTDIVTAEKDVVLADREVVSAERALKDAIDKFGANSGAAGLARADRNAKVAIKDGKVAILDTAKDTLKTAEQPIKDAEKELKVSENAVIGANRTRRENYAKTIQGGWSNAINIITSGLQHAVQGEREAANKILAGIKEEKK